MLCTTAVRRTAYGKTPECHCGLVLIALLSAEQEWPFPAQRAEAALRLMVRSRAAPPAGVDLLALVETLTECLVEGQKLEQKFESQKGQKGDQPQTAGSSSDTEAFAASTSTLLRLCVEASLVGNACLARRVMTTVQRMAPLGGKPAPVSQLVHDMTATHSCGLSFLHLLAVHNDTETFLWLKQAAPLSLRAACDEQAAGGLHNPLSYAAGFGSLELLSHLMQSMEGSFEDAGTADGGGGGGGGGG